MWPHRYVTPVDLAAALSQVANQFFARFELCACRLVAIEVSDQTNAERNVVQIIAVHVAAINLTPPAVPHLYLAIPSRCSVTDHEMIGQTILHPPDVPMIIIEDARVSLSRPTIVHNYELPTTTFDWRAADRFDHRSCEIAVTAFTAPGPRPKTSPRRRRRRRFETRVFLQARFLDYNLSSLFRRTSAWHF